MASMLALQSAALIQLRVDIGRRARVIQLEGSTKGAARRRRKEKKTHAVGLFFLIPSEWLLLQELG